MDIQHYKRLDKGNKIYFVLTSLETPYNTLMVYATIEDVESIENGERIYYYCKLNEFCNNNKYLDNFLNNKSFNLVDIKSKRIKDKTLRFIKGTKETDYTKQFKHTYKDFRFKVPISLALSDKESCIELITSLEDATIRYFNSIIDNFENKF